MVGICYVAPDVEIPQYRGASTHVLELARALSKLGSEVHVLCRKGASQPSIESINGVTLHRLYRGIVGPIPLSKYSVTEVALSEPGGFRARAYREYLQTVYALYSATAAASVISSFALDAIIERETAYGAGAIASWISRKPMLLELIGPRCSPLSIRKCFRLLAYNEKMVPMSARAKTVYVAAAFNPDLFRPDRQSGDRIRRRHLLQGKLVVGYAGTFQTFHGVEDLVRAAEKILQYRKDVRFLMVGPFFEAAKSLAEKVGISDYVVFTGPVPYPEVPLYMNACDVLVAPYNVRTSDRRSVGIGSPLKVLEYMACGVATVGSDLPQVSQLIDDGKTGVLFPAGDVNALANAVLGLIADESQRRQLGLEAQKAISLQYSWSVLAGKIQDILEEAVSVA